MINLIVAVLVALVVGCIIGGTVGRGKRSKLERENMRMKQQIGNERHKVEALEETLGETRKQLQSAIAERKDVEMLYTASANDLKRVKVCRTCHNNYKNGGECPRKILTGGCPGDSKKTTYNWRGPCEENEPCNG